MRVSIVGALLCGGATSVAFDVARAPGGLLHDIPRDQQQTCEAVRRLASLPALKSNTHSGRDSHPEAPAALTFSPYRATVLTTLAPD